MKDAFANGTRRPEADTCGASEKLPNGTLGMLPYPISDHCDGRRFFNPNASAAKGLLDVVRWKLSSRAAPWEISAQESIANIPPRLIEGTRCRITLINHSTVLLQCAGLNLLTDPIWSERASPFSRLGPRRFVPPGLRLEDLPKIDLVLLSHNHYDHFDAATLKWIQKAHSPRFIVPLGLRPLLAGIGIRAEAELDWWQQAGPVTCMPALHFSARALTDRNRTLWCGYWIETAAGPIYFAADTAFGDHFAKIRSRLGSPRVALLPIGAYKPEWFMGPVHMSPSQAVEAHRILAPERSIAIHWGTFQLADDGQREPIEDLQRALANASALPPFEAIENGDYIEVG